MVLGECGFDLGLALEQPVQWQAAPCRMNSRPAASRRSSSSISSSTRSGARSVM